MKIQGHKTEELLDMEWLDTNGIGGYASSTIIGANTRKYHGLLVASLNPPTDRKVLVAKVEERVNKGGKSEDLSVNKYPGTYYPMGHKLLKTFDRRPLANWFYEGEDWELRKKIFMVPGSNTTVVIYKNAGWESFDLELHPLLEHKDYHGNSHENYFDFYYEHSGMSLKIHAYPDSPPLFMGWSLGTFSEYRAWYKNVELAKEQFRGLDFREDYYRIGIIRASLQPGQEISLIFTTTEDMIGKPARDLERQARDYIRSQFDPDVRNSYYRDLLVAGSQFLVERASTNSKSIIAGYHWFTDWGRDTMIAMRGLTIATGRQQVSRSILATFFNYLDQGMLPNRFPDHRGQQVEYNTIDASLWLFVTLYEYYQKFGDRDFVECHMKDLESILLYHINGTRFNIRLTAEGFIYGGQESWQLTWMDALVDGHVVTPRIGCPVEINALWYNALCIYEYFCGGCDLRLHMQIKEVKQQFTRNFRNYFLTDEGYLYDVVRPGGIGDASFRPNQIYVASLPFSLLTHREEEKLVEMVGDRLLTDYGLRTLDKEDPRFVGTYGGNQWNRDFAYHQGTVWPFLLMEYWEAFLKVNQYSVSSKFQVLRALKPLEDHFYQAGCIHGISEIFDGDEPAAGRGCIHQAWSVAALVKLYGDHKLHELSMSEKEVESEPVLIPMEI